MHDDELSSSSSAPNYDNAEQPVGGSVARMLYLIYSNDVSVQRTLFQSEPLFTTNLKVAVSDVILRKS